MKIRDSLLIYAHLVFSYAAIAQLGERQTEDLKVPGSIPGRGKLTFYALILCILCTYDC